MAKGVRIVRRLHRASVPGLEVGDRVSYATVSEELVLTDDGALGKVGRELVRNLDEPAAVLVIALPRRQLQAVRDALRHCLRPLRR